MTEHTLEPSATAAPSAQSWIFAERFSPESEALHGARRRAQEFSLAPVERGTAATLTLLASAMQAKAVVEIGTGTGVSGLAFFDGMAADGILTSIDIEPEHQSAARQAFAAAQIPARRFRLINGAALTILPNLRDAAYDIVFIDGDKLEYVEYVAQALRLLRDGGMLIIDNALWHNRTADESNEDDETVIIREALDAVHAAEGLRAALLPVGDGLLVAVKHETAS